MSDKYRADLMALADRIDRHGDGEEGWETSPAHSWAEKLRRIVADRDDGKSGWMAHIEQLEEVIRVRRAELGWERRELNRVTGERDRLRNRVAELEDKASGYPTEDQLSPGMRRRLMPEGMEWPTVDGVPVKAGDTVCGYGLPEGAEVVAYTCGGATSTIVVRPTRGLPPDDRRPLLQWWSEDCRLPAQGKESADSFPKASTQNSDTETRDSESGSQNLAKSRVVFRDSREDSRAVDEGTGDKTNSSCDSSADRQKPQVVTDKPDCPSDAADKWHELMEEIVSIASPDWSRDYCRRNHIECETNAWVAAARDIIRRAKAMAGEGR